jgi:hypothetical protein
VKLNNGEYSSVADAWEDLRLVFSNAMVFNKSGSQIHHDAQMLMVCLHVLLSCLLLKDALGQANKVMVKSTGALGALLSFSLK